MPITALIPLKPPTEAKARLAGLLLPEERAELARVTFRTVADALFGASVPCVVLTPDVLEAVRLTAGRGALIEEQTSLQGFNAQLQAALDGGTFEGGDAVLILHADLPLVTSGALRLLVTAARRDPGGVTMVQSADGGTNAMVLPLPRTFALHYGTNSFALHAEAARVAGIAAHTHHSPEIALDLDTPADVQKLLATSLGRKSLAGRLLISMGIESRLAGGR